MIHPPSPWRQASVLEAIEHHFATTEQWAVVLPVYVGEDAKYLLSVIKSVGFSATLQGESVHYGVFDKATVDVTSFSFPQITVRRPLLPISPWERR